MKFDFRSFVACALAANFALIVLFAGMANTSLDKLEQNMNQRVTWLEQERGKAIVNAVLYERDRAAAMMYLHLGSYHAEPEDANALVKTMAEESTKIADRWAEERR